MKAIFFLLWGMVACATLPLHAEQNPYPVWMPEPLPTNRPITQIISYKGILVLGTDHGVHVRTETGWKKTFHHQVWKRLWIQNDRLYLIGNRYTAGYSRALLQLYSSHDAMTWKLIKDDVHEQIVVDEAGGTVSTHFQTGYDPYPVWRIDSLEHKTRFEDDRFKSIESIFVHERTGRFYVATNRHILRKKEGQPTFEDVNHLFSLTGKSNRVSWHSYGLTVFASINSHHLWQSLDGGESWKRIDLYDDMLSKGLFGIHSIWGVNDTYLILRINTHYMLYNYHNGSFRPFRLPEGYRFNAIATHNNTLFVSCAYRREKGFATLNRVANKEDKPELSLLLKIPLDDTGCDNLMRMPETLWTGLEATQGVILARDSVWITDGYRLRELRSNVTVKGVYSNKRLMHLKKGSLGHFHFRRHLSKNEGGGITTDLWRSRRGAVGFGRIPLTEAIPTRAIYDDSLNLGYGTSSYAVWRWHLGNGKTHRTRPSDVPFEGKIRHIRIDRTSQLFVLTEKGLYRSIDGGFETIPLPFLPPDHGWHLLDVEVTQNRIYLVCNDRLYTTRKDQVVWKEIMVPFCSTESRIPVRLLAAEDDVLALQNRENGQLLIMQPETGRILPLAMSYNNGMIRKAHVNHDTLLIETTGLPMQLPPGESRVTPPVLYQYRFTFKPL
jgi:hypothetical protein